MHMLAPPSDVEKMVDEREYSVDKLRQLTSRAESIVALRHFFDATYSLDISQTPPIAPDLG